MDTPTIEKRALPAVRNNNPGNIRITNPLTPWQGLMPADSMTPDQAGEKEFCVFQSPKWGFRAMARLLINYKDKYEIQTIAGVITRWAPPSENDTQAYIRHVAELTQQAADLPLDLHSFKDLRPLCKAIAIHESGSWLFEDADLDTGLTLAGAPPDVPALAKSRTFKAGGAAVVASAALETIQQIQPTLATIGTLKEYSAQIAIGLLVILAVSTMIWRIQDHLRAKDRQ